jgi:hypothetical protein
VTDVCDEDYSWGWGILELFCSAVAVFCGDADPVFDYAGLERGFGDLSAFLYDFPFILG